MDQGGCQTSKVRDVVEEQLCGLVHLLLVAALADLYDLGVVRAGDELLKVCQTVGFGKSKDKLGLNEGLARLLASHLEVADKVFEITYKDTKTFTTFLIWKLKSKDTIIGKNFRYRETKGIKHTFPYIKGGTRKPKVGRCISL